MEKAVVFFLSGRGFVNVRTEASTGIMLGKRRGRGDRVFACKKVWLLLIFCGVGGYFSFLFGETCT